MKGFKSFSEILFLFLACAMGIMLFYEDQIALPEIVKVLGRTHPMILHFPIVLVLLLPILELSKNEIGDKAFSSIKSTLTLLLVLSTVITAFVGLILANEGDHGGDHLSLHKWSGLAFVILAYLIHKFQHQNFYRPLVTLAACLVLVVGHFGASLTHGSDFLTGPLKTDTQEEINLEASIYELAIQPIIDNKCKSCHNDNKHKGGLNMASYEKLLLGGKNGFVISTENSEESEFLKRVHLPLNDDDHMPPNEKSQLTENEIKLFTSWVKAGATNQLYLADLNTEDELATLVKNQLYLNKQNNHFDFDFMSNEVVDELNNAFRTVRQITPEEPALEATIIVRSVYEASQLSELTRIGEQLVSITLSGLPIEDSDFSTISQFRNLRKLNLNGTDITGAEIGLLADLDELQSVSVSSTNTTFENLKEGLADFKNLKELFAWNTSMNKSEEDSLRWAYPGIKMNFGFVQELDELLTLSPPILANEKQVLEPGESIDFLHKMKGVKIRYTIDSSAVDSTSAIFSKSIPINEPVLVKAKAFKEGWKGSKEVSFKLLFGGVVPVNSSFLTYPNRKYPAAGTHSLFDGLLGNPHVSDYPTWLGYSEDAEILLDFGERPQDLNTFKLSYGTSGYRWMLPPSRVEIWGGNTPEGLTLMDTWKGSTYTKGTPTQTEYIELDISAQPYRYYKLIAKTYGKPPEWVTKSPDAKAWLFIDELFFY